FPRFWRSSIATDSSAGRSRYCHCITGPLAHMTNRDDAWALVCEYTQSDSLRKHMLAVEAAVRAYAKKFGEDVEKWGIVGLLHDFDYERWPNPPDHPLQGAEILK